MASEVERETEDDKTKEATLKITYNGVTKHVAFELNELVKAILDRAIQAFSVTQAPHLLSLFREDGSTVPDQSTAAAAGLKKNMKLFLRPDQVKGGTC
jgi:hypothetical protein